MMEHADRYKDFFDYCSSKHIKVYIHNHYAHGHLYNNTLGIIKNDFDYQLFIEDTLSVSRHIKTINQTSITLLGHSFGSYIAILAAASSRIEFKNLILTGTSFENTFTATIGKAVSAIIGSIYSVNERARYIHKLIFTPLNKPFKNDHQQYGWISHCSESINHYRNDSNCGFVCNKYFFQSPFYDFK